LKLLLDTCAILCLAADQARLSTTVRQAIATNPSSLFVSAISAFEIALKHRKGRLDLGMEPEAWWARAVAHHGLIVLPVTDEIAMASTALPPLHADPCDRIIIATGDRHALSIVTSDALISQYPSATILW
jgi:PIN domain nuclease of toxin-antitoxin system